jgi:hypothetical protein
MTVHGALSRPNKEWGIWDFRKEAAVAYCTCHHGNRGGTDVNREKSEWGRSASASWFEPRNSRIKCWSVADCRSRHSARFEVHTQAETLVVAWWVIVSVLALISLTPLVFDQFGVRLFLSTSISIRNTSLYKIMSRTVTGFLIQFSVLRITSKIPQSSTGCPHSTNTALWNIQLYSYFPRFRPLSQICPSSATSSVIQFW